MLDSVLGGDDRRDGEGLVGPLLKGAGAFLFIVGCAIPGCIVAWISYITGLWGPLFPLFWTPYGVYVPPLIGMVLGALLGWLVSQRWAASPVPGLSAVAGVAGYAGRIPTRSLGRNTRWSRDVENSPSVVDQHENACLCNCNSLLLGVRSPVNRTS
jgi:hypothetical protein